MPRGRIRLPDRLAAARETDRHREGLKPRDARPPDPAKVPPPPKAWKGTLRRVWHELAEQVEEVGTYTSSARTSFGLMVRNVAAVEDAPPDIAPTAYAHMQRAAAGWLARFGLTPADRGKAQAVAAPASGDRFGGGGQTADRIEQFLFGPRPPPRLAVVKGGRGE